MNVDQIPMDMLSYGITNEHGWYWAGWVSPEGEIHHADGDSHINFTVPGDHDRYIDTYRQKNGYEPGPYAINYWSGWCRIAVFPGKELTVSLPRDHDRMYPRATEQQAATLECIAEACALVDRPFARYVAGDVFAEHHPRHEDIHRSLDLL